MGMLRTANSSVITVSPIDPIATTVSMITALVIAAEYLE